MHEFEEVLEGWALLKIVPSGPAKCKLINFTKHFEKTAKLKFKA